MNVRMRTKKPRKHKVSWAFAYSDARYKNRCSMPFLNRIDSIRPSEIQKFWQMELTKSLMILGSIFRTRDS